MTPQAYRILGIVFIAAGIVLLAQALANQQVTFGIGALLALGVMMFAMARRRERGE